MVLHVAVRMAFVHCFVDFIDMKLGVGPLAQQDDIRHVHHLAAYLGCLSGETTLENLHCFYLH